MSTEPPYIRQMLDRAREEGQWLAYQPDCAALCFEVLALYPDHQEASELVYELFCDEWLIYENRVALQRLIDEWDDRPSQHRRRLALSLRYMSRWDGWRDEREDFPLKNKSSDVADLLNDAKGELLEAYCLGDEECTNVAWSIFADALKLTNNPRKTLLWIGKTYADLGFFADAVEALAELCSRFNEPKVKRLLVEVRWWRDNAHRIPWLPPRGDGALYRRMMSHIDPSAPTDEEVIKEIRARRTGKKISLYHPTIDSSLANLLASAIPEEKESSSPTLIDWSFLEKDDGQPGEPADWVKKGAKMFGKRMGNDMLERHRWTRNIPPPSTPPRYNPDEPPFDPSEFLGDEDFGETFDDDEEDDDL
ncbi:MAG: hypothetical protein HZB52_13880 [Chloroflexi bacterium]|nr:hypothetical protein [Chloroflexota bacterium]